MISARAVVRAAARAAAVFYRVERVGAELPAGPTLIVANHTNMLMDPLLVLWVARRPVRVLIKAPLFRVPIFGHVARGVGALPVFRVQDDPALLARNKATFAATIEALRAGETVLIFPEGGSQSGPGLGPLKARTARVALTSEEKSDWALSLKIVPLGLTYRRKHIFRSRAVLSLGEAIPVSRWRKAFTADRVVAIRSLTDAIADSLRGLTLNLTAHSEREIVETAGLLHARAPDRAPLGGGRGRGGGGGGGGGGGERKADELRLPELQRWAHVLAWLREHDGAGHARLSAALNDYRRQLAEWGAADSGVPAADQLRGSLSHLLRQTTLLVLALPLAAAGMIAWYLPFAAAGVVARLANPEQGTIATVKLLAGIIAFPAMYLGWIALAAGLGGATGAALAALALPPLAYLALRWLERLRDVWEDTRVLWRVVRRPQARDRLLELRGVLIGELDAVPAARDVGEGAARAPQSSHLPPPQPSRPGSTQ